MMTIWKYAIAKPGLFEEINLPISANIIHFDEDPYSESGMAFWAIVNTDKQTEPWIFTCIGTGTEMPYVGLEWAYVGTTRQGLFVFHLFKKRAN